MTIQEAISNLNERRRKIDVTLGLLFRHKKLFEAYAGTWNLYNDGIDFNYPSREICMEVRGER